MKPPYLQVTYVRGRPEVAYLRLPRERGAKSVESERAEPQMVLDFNSEGHLIGIELLAPGMVTLEAVNGVLKEYGLDPLKKSDLAPILAA